MMRRMRCQRSSIVTLAGVRGALALLVAAGTGVYLRSLRGLGAKLTPRE